MKQVLSKLDTTLCVKPKFIASCIYMTRLFLFLLVFISKVSFGQFNNSISKITFQYDKGFYTFGKSGKYSISEIIELTKSPQYSIFEVTKYTRINKSFDSATNATSIDTILFNLPKTQLTIKQIEKLLVELNTSRDNFNSIFVTPFLKKPTKKEIYEIAKKCGLYWQFENDNMDKKDRKYLFRKIKNFNLLDTFLANNRPNLNYEYAVFDVWNNLTIRYISKSDSIEYHCQFFKLFGQPINKYINNDYSKKNLNLEINSCIKAILPKNSLISKAVNFNNLKKEYIKWYLEYNL